MDFIKHYTEAGSKSTATSGPYHARDITDALSKFHKATGQRFTTLVCGVEFVTPHGRKTWRKSELPRNTSCRQASPAKTGGAVMPSSPSSAHNRACEPA